MIQFEKVSFEQFKKDWLELNGQGWTEKEIKAIYDEIRLPARSTSGSAGYDFYLPSTIGLAPNSTVHVLTGVRVKMPTDVVFLVFPRSSLGIKHNITLSNSTGVIDSDYYNAENEGHIHAVLRHDKDENMELKRGDRFMQGIFVNYLTADDDSNTNVRTGGIGSTGE